MLMSFNKLPCHMYKQELFKHLNDIPEQELRDAINEIIALNRRLPIDKAKFKKVVWKNEVKMVMIHFGYLEETVQ